MLERVTRALRLVACLRSEKSAEAVLAEPALRGPGGGRAERRGERGDLEPWEGHAPEDQTTGAPAGGSG